MNAKKKLIITPEQSELERGQKKEEKSEKKGSSKESGKVLYLPNKAANIVGPNHTRITMEEFERLCSKKQKKTQHSQLGFFLRTTHY